jgi:23S rRNA (cytosine1962-C5)-methyltransferase
MVLEASPAARPGDTVWIYDRNGNPLGVGLFNPRSQIVVRVLMRGEGAVDDSFWGDRVRRAVRLRREVLQLEATTDAYRLVHSEGDGLSGLIVERYADMIVCELFALGMHQRIAEIVQHVKLALGPVGRLDRPSAGDEWRVHVRADSRVEQIEGFRAAALPVELRAGQSAQPITIREHGIRYRVDVAEGHKTGFFCDQRDNRKRLARFCRGASVLDLCCYTGGFSLAAKLLGEADEVLAVDLDEAAIAMARANANLNQCRIEFVKADAFVFVRQKVAAGQQFDVVVLDPPKLVASRAEYEEGMRKYMDLNSLATQAVRPGGILLTCSCSGLVSRPEFLETVRRGVRRVGRTPQLFEHTGAGGDHPIILDDPESEYLKAAWLRVL